jgi:capsular exopolysaccharide synthesis family protein
LKKEGDAFITEPSTQEPPRDETHLKDYLRVLFMRRWIIIGVFFVVTAGVGAYVFIKTPVYRATAVLLIEPGKPNLTEFKTVYDPTMSDGDFNRRTFLETQYQLILSTPLIEKTFHCFRFGRKEAFRDLKAPIAKFRKCFAVSPVRRTRLAEVSFDWHEPELAAKVVDFHVNEYLTDYRQRRLGVSQEGLGALRERADELKPKVEKKAQALQRFMVDNNMVSLEKSQDIIVERMQALNRTLTEVERQRIHAETRYRNIVQAVESDRPLEQMPEIIESDTIRDLKLEYIRAKQETQGLLNRFGPNHPEVLAAEAKLESVTDKMKNEVEHVLASAESEYERSSNQETELKAALDQQQQKVMDFNEKSVEYNILKNDYDAINKTYSSVTQLIEEIEITIATGSNEDNIFIIARPKVPTRPVKPRRLLSMALAILAGLLLGVALCYFVEYLDTTIKTKDDAERLLRIPVMGYVPPIPDGRVHREGNGKKSIELLTLNEPDSAVAEAFRSIRTALTFSDGGEGMKSLLLTSSVPMEGKTLVSLNLAIALARTGKKVLLVDADMRRPRLSKVLSPSSNLGLSSLLIRARGATLDAAVQPTEIDNLHILPSGPVPPNPSELLGSDNASRLIAEMSGRYDHVLFDTPPVINATDAAVLCQKIHGALLIVRAFSTQQDLALRAREVLSGARGRLVGTIINSVDAPRGGRYGGYYYQHSYYYGPVDESGEASSPEAEERS